MVTRVIVIALFFVLASANVPAGIPRRKKGGCPNIIDCAYERQQECNHHGCLWVPGHELQCQIPPADKKCWPAGSLRTPGFTFAKQIDFDETAADVACDLLYVNGPRDCGYATRDDCRQYGDGGKGCHFYPDYPGAQCQLPEPKQCRKYGLNALHNWARLSVEKMHPLQWTAAFIAIVCLVINIAVTIWAEQREPATWLKQKEKREKPSVIQKSSAKSSDKNTSLRKRKGQESEKKTEAVPEVQKDAVQEAAVEQMQIRNYTDNAVCIVLLLLAFVTRFWRLHEPAVTVWDEVHFGGFTNRYASGTYFFDIHPPFAKLMMYFFSYFLGYDASFTYPGKAIDVPYENWWQFMPLRIVCALLGSFVIPISYKICRLFKLSPTACMLGSSLVLWDLLLLGETRLILTDGQLMLWEAITIYCIVKLCTLVNEKGDRKKPKSTDAGFTWTTIDTWSLVTAIACGNLFSVKFTGLGTVGIVGMEGLFGVWLLNKPLPFARNAVSIIVGVIMLFFWFAIHLYLIPLDSEDSLFHTEEWASALIGNPLHNDPNVKAPGLISSIVILIYNMIERNASILESHEPAAKWYMWVLGGGHLRSAGKVVGWEIFILTIPICIYVTNLALAVSIIYLGNYFYVAYIQNPRKGTTLYREILAKKPLGRILFFFVFGYGVNLLPYIGVARTTYIYHYMPSLLFAQLLSAVVFEKFFVPFARGFSARGPFLTYVGILAGLIGMWWFFSPWIYKIDMNHNQHLSRRRWIWTHEGVWT